VAEDKGLSFGHQGECAISHHSSGPTGCGSWPVCGPWSIIHSSTQSTPDIIRRSGVTRAAMQSLDNHFWKSCISIQQSWSCITLVSYQSFYTDLNAVQSPRWMHAGLMLLISGAWQLLGIKWHQFQFVHNEEVRRITMQSNLTAIVQSRRLSIFGHIAHMDDDADAQMILTAPPPENWKKPPERPCITWLCWTSSTRPQSLQPYTERSSWSGSEPSSVEAYVYVWCYALLVVHARKEEVTPLFISHI